MSDYPRTDAMRIARNTGNITIDDPVPASFAERLEAENAKLQEEVELLRSWGNKDCTAMADAELKRLRAEINHRTKPMDAPDAQHGIFPDRLTPAHFCPACEEPIVYEDELHFNGGGPPPSFQIRCGNCGAAGPYGHGKQRSDYDGGREDAIALWNAMPRKPQS